MKKTLLILLVLSVCRLYAMPQGKVIENLVMESEILDHDVTYSIYLPPDYDLSARYYPVVYLLHGFSDDNTAWVQFGEVNLSADRAIADREIPPMIIVMPDAKVTWYVNDYQGKDRYEDMFVDEFMPYIESHYRIRAKKEFRAVCGLSMGGYGTLVYALHHPDLFAVCAPFSAGVFTDQELMDLSAEQYDHWFQNIYNAEEKSGKQRLTDYWKQNNPLDLVMTMSDKDLKSIRYRIDCGDDDFLTAGNCELHLRLKERGIPHEFRVRDGYHNWLYWRTGITDALKFIGQSFHR